MRILTHLAAACSLLQPLRQRVAPVRRLAMETRGEVLQPEAAALGYQSVLERCEAAAAEAAFDRSPRLVAVSKTKPIELLRAAYDAGCRDFGENYAQELLEKSGQLPEDVRWRFIGHLQSNKAKSLVEGVPNLVCVETVDSEKLAKKLHNACDGAERGEPLGVMVQVNTSGEESKSGVPPLEGALSLCSFIAQECSNLHLDGLMTIGAPGDSSAFDVLVQTGAMVADELAIDAGELELSMGMSSDFEEAIKAGSTSVRVGSSIFGARSYPEKK